MTQSDADELWASAVEHHLAGRVPEAEKRYRQLLANHPRSAKVLHMLGMAEFQLGHGDEGLKLIDAAIAIDPDVGKYHGHRGFILASMGKLDAAINSYWKALTITPDAADVWNNLGTALQNKGDAPAAIDAFRSALRIDPSLSQSAKNLGSLLTNRGQHAEAIETLRTAMQNSPADGDLNATLATALNNLAAAQEIDGNPAQAEGLLREALLFQPTFAKALFNLGKALAGLHRTDEAMDAYRAAITHDPEMADAYNNLGILLKASGNVADAIEQYRNSLRRNPRQANAFSNLGNALRAIGKLVEAESNYRKAIAIDASNAAYWNNLGSVLDARERSDEALAAFAQAIALRPDFSEAHNNIGNAKKNLGDIDGALAAYQRAIDAQPDNQGAHSNRLYTMYFHPEYSAAKIVAEHRAWNAPHAAHLAPATAPVRSNALAGGGASTAPARRDLAADRLRIGYVAPFFKDHCQSFFTMPLFSHHDRTQFEIFAYSDVAVPDAMTARLRSHTDVWRDTIGISDESLADLIRSDEIDILVDLCLHMADNRLLSFARKPAPVQVTWLGYPGTTGLHTIDYRLTDPFLDPQESDIASDYSECSWRLQDTFWCYDPLTSQPTVNDLPLCKNVHVTFGCLNNFCKVNSPTLDLWAAVLRAVPHSKFLLLAPKPAWQRISDAMASRGVEPERLQFVGRMSRANYLATYHRIDIGLDTIPYNGHTTSLDAFWMGVPVITLVGDAPVGRAGWSQLNNLKLTELAATSPGEFVRIAQEQAEDSRRLRALRLSLRDRFAASPLMDGRRFAKNVETAFGEMWKAGNRSE